MGTATAHGGFGHVVQAIDNGAALRAPQGFTHLRLLHLLAANHVQRNQLEHHHHDKRCPEQRDAINGAAIVEGTDADQNGTERGCLTRMGKTTKLLRVGPIDLLP